MGKVLDFTGYNHQLIERVRGQAKQSAQRRWQRQFLLNFMMWYEFAASEIAEMILEMDNE